MAERREVGEKEVEVMLRILVKYPYAIAVGMPTMALLVFTTALIVMAAVQSNWYYFGAGLLAGLLTLYLGSRVYEFYRDERSEPQTN